MYILNFFQCDDMLWAVIMFPFSIFCHKHFVSLLIQIYLIPQYNNFLFQKLHALSVRFVKNVS